MAVLDGNRTASSRIAKRGANEISRRGSMKHYGLLSIEINAYDCMAPQLDNEQWLILQSHSNPLVCLKGFLILVVSSMDQYCTIINVWMHPALYREPNRHESLVFVSKNTHNSTVYRISYSAWLANRWLLGLTPATDRHPLGLMLDSWFISFAI